MSHKLDKRKFIWIVEMRTIGGKSWHPVCEVALTQHEAMNANRKEWIENTAEFRTTKYYRDEEMP